MYVIVGLGNPGAKYHRTHHNAGFDVLDILSEKLNIRIDKLKHKSLVGEGMIGTKKVVLAKPQTFMNVSGEAVVQLINWYKPEDDQLIIVYDDIDLDLGAVRVRAKGSAGTHNGMRSIIYLLGRDDFPRVRVGIGRPPAKWDLADYVLSGYNTSEEREMAFDAYMRAADAIQILVKEGTAKAQAFASAKRSEDA